MVEKFADYHRITPKQLYNHHCFVHKEGEREVLFFSGCLNRLSLTIAPCTYIVTYIDLVKMNRH